MRGMNTVAAGSAPVWRMALSGLLMALGLALVAPGSAMAQSEVEASAAQEFLGTWSLPIQGQQGSVELTLEMSEDADGMVAASISSPQGGQDIDTVTRSGETLTLGYSMSAQGQSIPVEIMLTPNGEELDAELEFGGGQFAMSATATRADDG